jgi:hypothetical protein
MTFNDLIGVIGVGMILLAYFCSVFRFITTNGKLFFLMNVIGAALACYASVLIDYWPFVVLEGMWTLVSIFGLIKTMRPA